MRTWAGFPLAGGIAFALVFAGCAGKPCRERGWIGGTLRSVQAHAGVLDVLAPAATGCGVVGMPASAQAPCGLLVREAPCGSPLAAAGVARGDLLVALDGRPVRDPEDFRRRIESRAPGSTATLDVWRDGARAPHPVTVGRERYERRGRIALALVLSPHADLNPFDDGVSLFGVVQAKSSDVRHDLASVERDYLRKAAPGRTPTLVQETTDVGVFPLYVGAQTTILSQEAVAMR
jgi:hypothetical protein